MGFIDELSSRPVLRQAWEKVAAKRGAPGIDRVTVQDFAANLDSNLDGCRTKSAAANTARIRRFASDLLFWALPRGPW